MNQNSRLSNSEISQSLVDLREKTQLNWKLASDKLHIELQFADFPSAMRFMQQAARYAENMDHHPEWCNIYNRVSINLVTHSASGISSLDFKLAEQMSYLFTKSSSTD